MDGGLRVEVLGTLYFNKITTLQAMIILLRNSLYIYIYIYIFAVT
jgi:hypothetical protein